MAAHTFTFKSLRSSAEFEEATTGAGPWTDVKAEELGRLAPSSGGAGRCLRWVLLPCCFCGFFLFAFLGTVSVVNVVEDQNYKASLIGGKLLPRPPPAPSPPPVVARSDVSMPTFVPPPPSPNPPWVVYQSPAHSPPPPPSPSPPNHRRRRAQALPSVDDADEMHHLNRTLKTATSFHLPIPWLKVLQIGNA